jgi:succinyl-diaminopimelate desuccinylase
MQLRGFPSCCSVRDTIEEANAHRADERLPLSDLFKATEVVALTLLDLLRA